MLSRVIVVVHMRYGSDTQPSTRGPSGVLAVGQDARGLLIRALARPTRAWPGPNLRLLRKL